MFYFTKYNINNSTQGKTVVAIVVVGRVNAGRVEVQVVGVVGIGIGVRTRRPIVAVVGAVVQLTRVHVARRNKIQRIRR